MKIALVGNQNSGKTTLFNALTGMNQKIGNWPGVTIERKEGILKGSDDITVVDLPGIYSLSPYTSEEDVSRRFILDEKPEKLPNQKVSADIELQLTILDSEDLQTECKTIARDIINGQGDNNNSTVDKILELFEDVLKQYPEESKDVAFVIGKYTEIIDQSDELTEEEKMVLKSTFATALCSSKYWEDNMQ